MRLAGHTADTLRVPMHCAARQQQMVTSNELTEHHGVSRNLLIKIVTDPPLEGFVQRSVWGHIAKNSMQ